MKSPIGSINAFAKQTGYLFTLRQSRQLGQRQSYQSYFDWADAKGNDINFKCIDP